MRGRCTGLFTHFFRILIMSRYPRLVDIMTLTEAKGVKALFHAKSLYRMFKRYNETWIHT